MAILIRPEILLEAYADGAFPMAVAPGEIRWFSPDPRGILPLDAFHIPHGARSTVRDPAWRVTRDRAFEPVMRACADRAETWIDDIVLKSYVRLHELGRAHSVEVWRDGELAGGLYGIAIGGAFFGESMFHHVSGASKVALVHLVEFLRESRFGLLDIQWLTPHLASFGAIEIPRPVYLIRLKDAMALDVRAEWSRPGPES